MLVPKVGEEGSSSHTGLASSHFFFLERHVRHPVLERDLTGFVFTSGTTTGCFRGLPRGRLALTMDAVEGSSRNAGSRGSLLLEATLGRWEIV